MNNGNKRRARRRQSASKSYHVRYDRIVAAVLVLIVLIVILASCAKSCSGDKGKSDSSSTSSTKSEGETDQTIVDDLQSSGDTKAIIGSASETVVATAPQFTTETFSQKDMKRGSLILVNEAHEYSFESEDTELQTLYDHIQTEYYSVSDYVTQLDSKTIEQLNSLMGDFYQATNCDYLTVIGGYRTLEEQNDRYNNGYSKFKGGYSDYHTGRSFDIGVFPKNGQSSGYYTPTGDYSWFDEHAADYGFIVRFPEGKEQYTGEEGRTHTYRYVGVPHAVYMKQSGLCLEEYIDEVKTHNSEDPITVTVDSKLYSIYYEPASAGDTVVTVPSNKTYTVSGNNVDGFIITVEMN
ncbi:MAG: M15 family metallopeptidase [Ruminococcus sp.]|nr:M15 family metallopeptidase [Ruminococcus sp.]